MDLQLDIEGYRAGEKKLIAAKSYLIDRFSPATEHILLPAYNMPAGHIVIKYSGNMITSESNDITSKRKTLNKLKRLYQKTSESYDGIVIDLRRNTPGNWAHTLNFHIPFAFFVIDQLHKHNIKDPYIFILSENTPSYIKNIFALFELPVQFSDNTILAKQVEFNQAPFDCLRTPAIHWVRDLIIPQKPYQQLQNATYELPKRVFLSRRSSRNISNEEEVENFLLQYKFEKIYPEDLTVEQQLQIFMKAEAIIAVHGAAIGPMMYRSPVQKTLKLLEILTPGHMTNYYRGMADQVGVEWCGVRGRLSPDHVSKAYDFSTSFLEYSLTSFEVCTQSLQEGLELLALS
ncbi:glycosyltransferase family 61 protein [Gynuella sp.]|uniref:glycosyltransferase family 61 protein n=1 Tax=Gynuella sp. TaxID=2969146 RepID=UPI003D0D0684